MILKKALKITGRALLGLIAFILIYLLAAFVLSRISVAAEHAADEMAIYILTNGVHTDIVMPVRTEQMDWSRQVSYANTPAADNTYGYLAMGWGDKGFYLETPTWSELKASVAFNAAFGLGTTAMHTTFYRSLQEGESCKKIMISKGQYARLVQYITDSFQQGENGRFRHIETDANYGKTDAFYEANGRYSMVHTCNTWANNALKHSGLKACLWTAFDTGIFLKYE